MTPPTATFVKSKPAVSCEICNTPVLHGAVYHPDAGYVHFYCLVKHWLLNKKHPERWSVDGTCRCKRSRK